MLGFADSLRRGSDLLRTAQELPPEGMVIEIADFTSLLRYNADVEAQGDAEPVAPSKRRADRLTSCSSPTPNTTTVFRAC
jgi:hypothetical protein